MIDFDTYIKMGEPGGKERAEAWKTAIVGIAFLNLLTSTLIANGLEMYNKIL